MSHLAWKIEQDASLAPAASLSGPPYVGPRPFTRAESERFFGRDAEARQLASLIVAERIVILHGPAGAGKSSLIQARLIAALEQRFEVLPVIRLNFAEPADRGQPGEPGNRYVESSLRSLGGTLGRGEDAAPLPSLSAFLSSRARPGSKKPDLLIFDQFEEILTLDPTDHLAKVEFFRQLGAALAGRSSLDAEAGDDEDEEPAQPRWALFAVRDDSLAAIEPYLPLLGVSRPAVFRLGFLDRAKTIAAICGPAARAGVEIEPETAEWLFQNLSRRQVARPGRETPVWIEGHVVEPVQLQVVCQRVWDALPLGQRHISKAFLDDYLKLFGDDPVDMALQAHYADALRQIERDAAGRITERDIRLWIDRYLIARAGVRSQVIKEYPSTEGLANEALDALTREHLIKQEDRSGVVWIELAHDRLVRPIRMSNEAWYEKTLSPLQISARAWERNRSTSLLLRGKALRDAREWSRRHPEALSALDREFLQQSEQLLREKQFGAGFVAAFALLTILVFVFAVWAYWERHAGRVAVAERRAIDAHRIWPGDPNQAIFEALVAWQAHPEPDEPNIIPRSTMAELLARSGGQILHGHTGPINRAALTDRWLLTASQDKTLQLWDRERLIGSDGGPLYAYKKHDKAILDLAVNESGALAVTAGVDQKVRIWDLVNPSRNAQLQRNGELVGPRNVIRRVTIFGAAGADWVCAVGQEPHVYFWKLPNFHKAGDAAGQAQPLVATDAHQGRVDALYSSSRFPGHLVTGGQDGICRVWSIDKIVKAAGEKTQADAGDVSYAVKLHSGGVADVNLYRQPRQSGAPSPSEGELWLITAGVDKDVCFTSLTAIESAQESGDSVDGVLADVRQAPGAKAAWADSERPPGDASVRRFGRAFRMHANPLVDIGVGHDQRLLITGSEDGKAIIWWLDLILDKHADRAPENDASQFVTRLEGHDHSVTDIAISRDGAWAATAGEDSRVCLWRIPSSREETIRPNHTIWLPNSVRVVTFGSRAAGKEDDLLIAGADDELVRVWKLTDEWLDWERDHLCMALPPATDKDETAQSELPGASVEALPDKSHKSRLDALRERPAQELAETCRKLLELRWGPEEVARRLGSDDDRP